MAVIPYSVDRVHASTKHVVTWASVTEADTCAAFTLQELPLDISAHIYGTFGGATGVLKIANGGGSGVNAKSLDSVAISMTTEGLVSVLERPNTITPTFSGGTSQSLTVAIILWYAPQA